MGKSRMAMSQTMVIDAAKYISNCILTQCPSPVWVQKKEIGVHKNTTDAVPETKTPRIKKRRE